MALIPTQACPMCSHMSCLREGASSQLQPLLCAALLFSRVGKPTWLVLYAKINAWSSRVCWPFTGWCRLGKCACRCSHMLLFRNISKPWTWVEQMHMILFWQSRIVLQMELTCLYSSSKCCPAQRRIKCAMKVVICVIKWPTEDTFLQVLPGDPHPTEIFLTHTEIMSLLTHAYKFLSWKGKNSCARIKFLVKVFIMLLSTLSHIALSNFYV